MMSRTQSKPEIFRVGNLDFEVVYTYDYLGDETLIVRFEAISVPVTVARFTKEELIDRGIHPPSAGISKLMRLADKPKVCMTGYVNSTKFEIYLERFEDEYHVGVNLRLKISGSFEVDVDASKQYVEHVISELIDEVLWVVEPMIERLSKRDDPVYYPF